MCVSVYECLRVCVCVCVCVCARASFFKILLFDWGPSASWGIFEGFPRVAQRYFLLVLQLPLPEYQSVSFGSFLLLLWFCFWNKTRPTVSSLRSSSTNSNGIVCDEMCALLVRLHFIWIFFSFSLSLSLSLSRPNYKSFCSTLTGRLFSSAFLRVVFPLRFSIFPHFTRRSVWYVCIRAGCLLFYGTAVAGSTSTQDNEP